MFGQYARYCPECLAEVGYWRFEWKLAFYTVCHRHRRVLIDRIAYRCIAAKQLGIARGRLQKLFSKGIVDGFVKSGGGKRFVTLIEKESLSRVEPYLGDLIGKRAAAKILGVSDQKVMQLVDAGWTLQFIYRQMRERYGYSHGMNSLNLVPLCKRISIGS